MDGGPQKLLSPGQCYPQTWQPPNSVGCICDGKNICGHNLWLAPARAGSSLLMRRTFMRLFCAHCALRGQLWHPKVSRCYRAMAVIIRDDQELRDGQEIPFPDTSSYGHRLEITRLRRPAGLYVCSCMRMSFYNKHSNKEFDKI